MIAPSKHPDFIDKLLTKIMNEAEQESKPVIYASFTQRVIARLIDMAIITGVTVVVGYLAFNFIRKDTPQEAAFIINGLTQALPAFGIMLWVTLYSPIMESTGGTIGKRIAGIKMVNDDSERKNVRFLTCAARAWVYLVFIMLLLLPAIASCVFVLFNDKKMAFHDKMFNMVCVSYR